MHLPGAALVQKLCGFPKLCTPHNGIIDEKQAPVLNKIVDRNQFHFCDKISLTLNGGHERTRPRRRILDEGPGEGNSRLVGVTYGVCGA